MHMPQPHPQYCLFELRRHRVVHPIDAWFPDVSELPGAEAVGQFIERGDGDRYTCLRGYASLGALDAALDEGDDALLLRPLYPDSGVALLPAVDPVAEPQGAQGLAVAQVFPVAEGRLADCARAAEAWFAHYGGRGVTEAGILATLPRDGRPAHGGGSPAGHLVWLGVLCDEAALASLTPMFHACAAALQQAGLLAGPAELRVLEPAPRSRLRWIRVIPTLAQPARIRTGVAA